MDQLAHELGMDPLELRRKNFIPPFATGHEIPIGVVYDSGQLRASAGQAARAHRPGRRFAARPRRCASRASTAASASRTYTEICGLAPSRVVGSGRCRAPGRRLGVGDGPRPRHGLGDVYTGTSPTARVTRRRSPRSSPTGSASIRASVEVIHGDTGHGPAGSQHVRLAVAGRRRRGGRRAANKVADKAKAIVAHQLEAAPEDIEVARRQVLGARIARQGHDARRGGGRRVRDDGHARGHGAGARRAVVLRPGELRVPVRRARVRSSTSTRRPERSRSSATSRSTTADRRSTRC